MSETILEFGAAVPYADYILRPGGYLVISDQQSQIAVVSTPKGVFLPGGGVDGSESAAQAAVRETLEECGLHVRIKTELGTADELVFDTSEEKYYRKRCVFFSGELIGSGLRREVDHRLIWMGIDSAIRQLDHQSQAWAVMRAARLNSLSS